MLELKYKIGICIVILVIIGIMVTCDGKKNINEKFTNKEYQKFKETAVPIKKEGSILKRGNLDQCKMECDKDDKCVGFVRDNTKADDLTAECHIIQNVVNCHNDLKEPSEKYLLSPGISDNSEIDTSNFSKFDTYLKLDVPESHLDNIQKCIRLEQKVGMAPRRYPFSLLVLDDNNNLQVMDREKSVNDKNEVEEDTFYSKYSVFIVVKGLSGIGVSFKVNKNNADYYIVRKETEENLVAELEDDTLDFKKKASFIIDMEYPEKDTTKLTVDYISIKHDDKKGTVNYWKVNEVTKKVILIKKDKLGEDLEDIMFTLKDSLYYKEEGKKNNKKEVSESLTPISSPSVTSVPEVKKDDMKGMEDELEKLELDIRQAQHKQNVKLMNIMLDVNKFKLHDLSMSNYLTQCVRTSEEPPTYLDTKIKSGISNTNNNQTNNQTNINNNNINNNNERVNTLVPSV